MKKTTNANIGQEYYPVPKDMHKIRSIKLDGVEVKYEVCFKLKGTPVGSGQIEVSYNLWGRAREK